MRRVIIDALFSADLIEASSFFITSLPYISFFVNLVFFVFNQQQLVESTLLCI